MIEILCVGRTIQMSKEDHRAELVSFWTSSGFGDLHASDLADRHILALEERGYSWLDEKAFDRQIFGQSEAATWNEMMKESDYEKE